MHKCRFLPIASPLAGFHGFFPFGIHITIPKIQTASKRCFRSVKEPCPEKHPGAGCRRGTKPLESVANLYGIADWLPFGHQRIRGEQRIRAKVMILIGEIFHLQRALPLLRLPADPGIHNARGR